MVVDEVAALGYMALSYCWGGPQPLVLNRATAKHLQQQGGVPVTELPQTLADAVQVAQAVGLSYLWVDALCIMQDSEDDKAGEIARMAQYYSGSVVTLCAASAKRCTDGFLGVREDDPSVYSLGPVVLQARTSSGRMGSVLVFGENSDEAEDRREPTTMRGWTLQESLLSRRLLIFSSRQLHFSCMLASASCGGPLADMKLKRRMTMNYESPVSGISTLSGLHEWPPDNIWFITMQQYNKRHITDPKDRLPALSAVASVLTNMARSIQKETLIYLAGLWLKTQPKGQDSIDTGDITYSVEAVAGLCTGLMWRTDCMETAAFVADNGPSWSWATMTGPLELYPSNAHIMKRDGHAFAQLYNYSIQLDNQLNPYGRVRSGRLEMEVQTCNLALAITEAAAATSSGNVYGVFVAPDSPPKDAYKQTLLELFHTTLELLPDTLLRKDQVMAVRSSGMRESADGAAPLLLLLGLATKDSHAAGLIVKSTGKLDEVERVGLFDFHTKQQQLPFGERRKVVLV